MPCSPVSSSDRLFTYVILRIKLGLPSPESLALINGGDDDDSNGADDPGKPAFWLHGLEEAPTPFQGLEPPPLETYAALYRVVLANYDYCCALTGLKAHSDEPDASLRVCAIRPRGAGGNLHVSNFLCLSPAADQAFMAGHLTIGPHYQIIVDLRHVDPELLAALNADGRLAIPMDPDAAPDPLALAFHRSRVFLAGLPS